MEAEDRGRFRKRRSDAWILGILSDSPFLSPLCLCGKPLHRISVFPLLDPKGRVTVT